LELLNIVNNVDGEFIADDNDDELEHEMDFWPEI
jgi:hypothetical protein